MRTWVGPAVARSLLLAGLCLGACGGDDDDTPPPVNPIGGPNHGPVTGPITGPNTGPQVVTPPGQVMVTVVAASTPTGATVTGGGRLLGTTPLSTQVPVPVATPGQLQTFAFTFQMPGYQPATINASPVNNTITITAALAPMIQGNVGGQEQIPVPVGGGRVLNVNGGGGGPIFDNHTTTGAASVDEPCTIADLSVRLSGTHSFFQDLVVTLRGPDGQSYSLQRRSRANPFRAHNVRRARGRSAQGRWTIAIEDTLAQDSGILRGWGMTITCQ